MFEKLIESVCPRVNIAVLCTTLHRVNSTFLRNRTQSICTTALIDFNACLGLEIFIVVIVK
jgi:hypothetical protein